MPADSTPLNQTKIAGGNNREDWMFVEQRLYTCAPGNTGEFLKVYENEGRAPQTRTWDSRSDTTSARSAC